MKRTVTILKATALLVLAVAGVEGFFFAQVWQQNPRPRNTAIQWTSRETRLGAPAVLRVDMKLPWHQRPVSAQALRLPPGWVAQQGGTWTEGSLDPTGFRHWSLESILVPVETSPASGETIAWSLRSVSGPSPRPAEFVIPSLSVVVPTELADKPHNPSTPLVYQPPQIALVTAVPPPPTRPWIWLNTAFIVAAFIWWCRRMLLKRSADVEPPWTRALANLAHLAETPLGEAQAYCTRLSDILKEYSTHRFECNLVGTSSTEFLRELARCHPLADEDKQALQATLGHADLVRFAGAELARDSAAAAVEHARRFVINTTPTTDLDRA